MADSALELSGQCPKDGGIWGALIAFNEATLVLDKLPTFTAFSLSHAKHITLFDLFALQSALHPHGGLRCQTYICIIHLYRHLLEIKGYMKP